MAWTDPRSWTAGEMVDASLMNTQVRDNLRVASFLLGRTTYNPGVAASYTRTSSTFADVDAANLSVTFTVPQSGVVIVRLQAAAESAATASWCQWNVRESTSDLSGTTRSVANISVMRRATVNIRISGLTNGASKTYKWGHASSDNATTVTTRAGGAYGAAVLEVWAGV